MKMRILFVTVALLLSCIMVLSACDNSYDASSSDKKHSSNHESTAHKASEGLEFEKDPHNPYYVVSGIGICTDTTVYIPEEYEGLPVKEIGSDAFKYCTSFSKIVLPSSIKEIGKNAFYQCESLTEIVLPEGLQSIGDTAFTACQFSSIELPSSLTSLGDAAFLGCSALKSITIPNTIKKISNSCFSGCTSLTDVIIPEGVTIIEAGAFLQCSSLRNINLPESLEKLNGFEECTSLRSITIPKNVTTVHAATFDGCIDLEIHCYADLDLSYLEGATGTIRYYN